MMTLIELKEEGSHSPWMIVVHLLCSHLSKRPLFNQFLLKGFWLVGLGFIICFYGF